LNAKIPLRGVTIVRDFALEAKRLELLHECVPQPNEIAYLVNPESSETEAILSEVSAAARVIGVKLLVLKAGNANDIDAAFAELSKQRLTCRSRNRQKSIWSIISRLPKRST
jgi:ABC-type uncharacterized transport system substrate-binding protein